MISYNIGSRYNFYSSQPTSQFKSFSMSFVDPMIFDTPNRVGFSFFSTFRGQGTSYYFPLDLRMVGGQYNGDDGSNGRMIIFVVIGY